MPTARQRVQPWPGWAPPEPGAAAPLRATLSAALDMPLWPPVVSSAATMGALGLNPPAAMFLHNAVERRLARRVHRFRMVHLVYGISFTHCGHFVYPTQ